ERGQHHGSDSGELRDPGNDDSGQRIGVRGGGDEHGGDGDERFSDADGESGPGGARNHHATGEPDGDGGTDGHVYGHRDRDGAAPTLFRSERGQHRGSDSGELRDPGDDDFGQRIGVRGGGDEHGGDGNERFR